MTTSPVNVPLNPLALRADFPVFCQQEDGADLWSERLAYLDNASTTQCPRQVISAMLEVCERHYGNVHRASHWLGEWTTTCYEKAREKVRAFLNAPAAEQVIFTSGATQAINLVAHSWGEANLHPGDEILLTEMEHHANLVPWQQLAQRRGARLRYLPLTDDGQLSLDDLEQLLTRRTRLVAVTAVSNVLGTINPIEQITARAHRAGAVVLVDGAQSVPHQRTDVRASDVDFLAFSAHKMLGPNGVGVLYGRRELLEAMPPFLGGGNMIRRVTLDGFEPNTLPAKFEAGTPPIVQVVGLGAAIDYLNKLGMEAIAAHERQLTERAHQVLAAVDGVRILGPQPPLKSAIVSFTLEGVHPHDAAELLNQQGIAVRVGHHCAMPLHQRYGLNLTIRASFYLYNTVAEVTRFGDALKKVRRFFHQGG